MTSDPTSVHAGVIKAGSAIQPFPRDDSLNPSFLYLHNQSVSWVLAIGVVSSGNVMLWHLVQIDKQRDRTEFSSMALGGSFNPSFN